MGNTISANNFNLHYPKQFPCNQLEERSYSDLNSLSSCISSIKGQDSNSTSPTDIYILKDYKNTTYFMKTFITSIDKSYINNTKKFEDEIYPLIYEYGVYLGKINKFVKYNICPFFVTTKGGKLHNNKDEILNFLNGKLYDVSGIPLSYNQIEANFVRNIKTIINNMFHFGSKINRKSINNNLTYNFNSPLSGLTIDDKYKFGYFITQGFNNSKSANDVFLNYVSKLNTFTSNNFKNFKQLLLLFVFQMAIAFKSLDLSKISNCDIHLGNVLFDNNLDISHLSNVNLTNDTNNSLFFIENNIYKINLPFLIKIYDFDRSYVYGNGTSSSEIKNTHFSVSPTYNKSTLRDFLFPITILIKMLCDFLVTSAPNQNTIDEISDIVNKLSTIILKNNSPFTIYITNPSNLSVNSNIPSIISINSVNIPVFSKLNNYSKTLLIFLNHISKTTFSINDPYIRNKELNDKTFDNFNNFDDIINLTYNEISSSFKNLCINNIECISNINISKYYLSKKFFDNEGILSKKDLYKTINENYSIQIKNLDNNVQRLNSIIQQLNIDFNNKITLLNTNFQQQLLNKENQLKLNLKQLYDTQISAYTNNLKNELKKKEDYNAKLLEYENKLK